ncbi:MAG: hypothetical protein DLM73_09170 [Chthoniobacterales bacterium]|nr:MAG: hypothetical protein DLM73_09170 [Chthoniobacterales bacterium]
MALMSVGCLSGSKASVLGCLVWLSAWPLASGQAGQPKFIPQEALEKYEDAPAALVWRSEVSPGLISQQGGFTSYQVNVDANGRNITGDAANEPSISLDPNNPNKMAIGWRQFNNVSSNFRQAGWGYTRNGGASWTFPGVLENNVFRSDPVLGSDNTGNFFYLSLLQNLLDDMWRSPNGGQSWMRLNPATGGDKQWFTIDNTNSSGHGFQYQTWSTASNPTVGRQFSRSTDGGFNWMNPIAIPNAIVWGTLDVDTSGNLFVGGVNPNSMGQFWSVRSSNTKNAGVTPTFDRATVVNLGGVVGFSNVINPEGLVGQVFLSVDRSGGTTNNNIYMLASVQPFGLSTGSEVMFARSTDGGSTFSAPRRINDDPINHNKWHWFGTLSVAPNGRIDVVWLDTRNAANNTDSQLFYSYSTDGGDTWSPNVAASNSFDPYLGYPNQNKMGDYITMVSDNAGGNVAYTATFNSEEDIYYVRVSPSAAFPTPTPTPAQALNISTRLRVDVGDKVMIGGFIITGNAPKSVVLRGMGPSLVASGVPDAAVLHNPYLELHGPPPNNALISSNDDWINSPQKAQIQGTIFQPTDPRESVILATLSPGNYTAILTGAVTGGVADSGIGLVEAYDIDQTADSVLGNISTRGFVDTGTNVMIGGFTLGGNPNNARIAVRGLGPSLTQFGLTNVLADPTLELHDSNGALLISNDDWQNDALAAAQLSASGLALKNPKEAGIFTSLPPGQFTAILAGKNGAGIGLIEIYNLK